MKYKKAKEKKKRKRLKKVYSARTLLHVYLEGKIPEGWTRDGSQSMEGRHYYAGRGPERVKIASKFQGFLWVHPVSRYLRNYPDFEYWYQEVPTDGDYGCPVAEAVLKGFLHKDAVDKPVWKRRWNNPPVNNVFVVPLVPQSTSAHLANAEYLADLAQSHRNISRLKNKWTLEGRHEAFKKAVKHLDGYCEFFGVTQPEILGAEEMMKTVNARKALMKIQNPNSCGGGWNASTID